MFQQLGIREADGAEVPQEIQSQISMALTIWAFLDIFQAHNFSENVKQFHVRTQRDFGWQKTARAYFKVLYFRGPFTSRIGFMG